MTDQPEWLANAPGWLKGVAMFLAAIAAGAAGWSSLGFPVPMTVNMHAGHHAQEEAIESVRSSLAFAQKVVEREVPGTSEYDEAVQYRDALQIRLDSLLQ